MGESGMEVGRQAEFNFLESSFYIGRKSFKWGCSKQSLYGFVELGFFLVEATVSLGISIKLRGLMSGIFLPGSPVMSQLNTSVSPSSK